MRRSFVSPPSRRAAVSSSSVAFVVSSAFAVSAMFAGCSIYDPSLLVDAPPDYSGYAGADSEGGTGGTDSEGGTGGTDSEGGTGGTDSEGGTGGTESGGTGGTETTGGTGGSAAGTGGTASGSGGVSGNSGTGGSSGSAAGTGGASGKGGSSGGGTGGSAGATGGTAGAGGTAGTGGSTAGTGGAAGAPGGSGGSAGATGGSGGSAGATGGSGGSAGATGGSGGSAGASGGAGGSAGGGSGCTGIVLINEVSVEGPASKADDFVELYNPNDCEVSLDGWTLKYAASSATAFQTSVLWTGTATTILAPHGYYVLGGSSYAPAGTADATMKSGITTPAGVGLFNKDGGDPVDRVAWGNVDVGTHPAVETAPAPAPVGYKSIGRSSASKDTDNNAVDFTGQDRSPGAANP